MTNASNYSSNNNNSSINSMDLNNNMTELNKIKTKLKREVSKLNTEATTLNALIQRIDLLGQYYNNNSVNPVRVARRNALRIQRVIHPNKSFPLTRGIANSRLRNKVRRNLTNISAAFQI